MPLSSRPATRRTNHASRRRHPPLRRTFYRRPADVVARALLGCILMRRLGRTMLTGRIVETEAYLAVRDRASHASRGRTPRNSVMYGHPGHAYVYFVYGMYDMLNIVCQPEGVPEAVLIRGVAPLEGVDAMLRRRSVKRERDIANGPGKLCRAFAITRDQNRADLSTSDLWITRGRLRAAEEVARSPRIGVDYAGEDAKRPLRFYIAGDPHVSPVRVAT